MQRYFRRALTNITTCSKMKRYALQLSCSSAMAVSTPEPVPRLSQVYIFSKGTVKNANKKFSTLANDYELSMDQNTEITEV